jgi:PAT family beta-lactamase induction signal transducer AmpG
MYAILNVVSMIPFRDKLIWAIFTLGFCSGIPFLLTLSTLSFWLSEAGLSKTTIGLFMLVTLPYSFKFLWAPFLDRFQIKGFLKNLGHRRGWLCASQLGLMVSVYILGHLNPLTQTLLMALTAAVVTFFASTQDILIDVLRLEWVSQEKSPMAVAYESIGFRLGMLVSGAGALYLAEKWGWNTAYSLMALLLALGPLTTLMMENRDGTKKEQKSLSKSSISFSWWIQPFHNLKAQGAWISLLIVIFSFKCTDVILNSMCAPFLCELGFSKIEFANITKIYGIGLMMVGSFLGGISMTYLGKRTTIIGSFLLQAFSAVLFMIQSSLGHDIHFLTISIGFESFASGLAATSFITFLSQLCRQKETTAANFTFLYSLGSLSRVIISFLAGVLADITAWHWVFILSVIPSMVGLFAYLNVVKKTPSLLLFHPQKI